VTIAEGPSVVSVWSPGSPCGWAPKPSVAEKVTVRPHCAKSSGLSAPGGSMEARIDGGPHPRMRAEAREQQAESMMEQQPMTSLTEVAASTMAAAHRRDHQHSVGADDCHPQRGGGRALGTPGCHRVPRLPARLWVPPAPRRHVTGCRPPGADTPCERQAALRLIRVNGAPRRRERARPP